jgi:4-hydroxyphenylpyruvate dioxygenase
MGVNRIAIATNALGKSAAGHSIRRKLQAASDANFEGVEVAIECLEAHANTAGGYREDNMRWAATDIRSIASNLSLTIVALNPFAAYDALREENAVESRLKEAQLWLDLCKIMHASILQVG